MEVMGKAAQREETAVESLLLAIDIVRIHKARLNDPLLHHHLVIRALVSDLVSTASTRSASVTEKLVDLLAHATNCDKKDITFSLALIKDLSPISNYDIFPFTKVLHSPACTLILMDWIAIQLKDTTSFDRYIDMEESPVLLDILIEIAIAQPLQVPDVFNLLSSMISREYSTSTDDGSVTPLLIESWKRVFSDFCLILVKLGYHTKPIFAFFLDVDEYLKVHFVKSVLEILEPDQYPLMVVEWVLDMLQGIPLENFIELRETEEAKEAFKSFLDFVLGPFSEIEKGLYARAEELKRSLNKD
ncbi:MAG: hypothetical protein SGCHY_000008 [Lobulomycetales sp.]